MQPWIEEIAKCRSLSIVGLEKNTGKTETLNYILHELRGSGRRIAVTSIGIDGERRDQVCQIEKPEIELHEGMLFATTERHYRDRRLTAEVLCVGSRRTALGRLVTARVVVGGKVLLSGPADNVGLRMWIADMARQGADLTIIDGALSRLSHGSPAVCEGVVLCTGAAVSATVSRLVERTKFVCGLMRLEAVETELARQLAERENGVWLIGEDGEVTDSGVPSSLLIDRIRTAVPKGVRRLYVAGAVSDGVLRFLRTLPSPLELVIADFTRMFATAEAVRAFEGAGNRIRVVRQPRLMGVTVNPVSPTGIRLNSAVLRQALEGAIGVPVVDVRE